MGRDAHPDHSPARHPQEAFKIYSPRFPPSHLIHTIYAPIAPAGGGSSTASDTTESHGDQTMQLRALPPHEIDDLVRVYVTAARGLEPGTLHGVTFSYMPLRGSRTRDGLVAVRPVASSDVSCGAVVVKTHPRFRISSGEMSSWH